ncbi:MAG: DMT family transporter [Eubacteriales bacterium]|nr:DMT family transporter [Eubacteriales bacterium]
MKCKMTPLKADLLLLILAIVWGSGYSVTKVAVVVTSPIQFLTYRFVISSILSFLFFRKKFMKADRSDWFAGGLMGVFLAAGMLIQTIGIQYTSAGKTSFIASAFVIMVPFFYWCITKEKPSLKIVAATFVMMIGLGMLFINPGGIDTINKGDLLILISAVSFAMHTTIIGIFAPKKDPYLLSGIQFITCCIILLILSFFDSNRQEITFTGVTAILYSAVIITFVCFIVQVVCQKYTSPGRAAIIINLETVFGALIAILFLGESYSRIMTIAFVVIFISVLIAEVNIKKVKI